MRPVTKETLEMEKLNNECELLKLQSEVLRSQLNPPVASSTFIKIAHVILSYGTGASVALGTACFALASGVYVNGNAREYCHDLKNGPVRDACSISAFGSGCVVAGVGFFAIAKVLKKMNGASDTAVTHVKHA